MRRGRRDPAGELRDPAVSCATDRDLRAPRPLQALIERINLGAALITGHGSFLYSTYIP